MTRSILVPLDGSVFGEHALPLAASLARQTEAAPHLVHVHQVIPTEVTAGVALMSSLDLLLREEEQTHLTDVARRLGETVTVPLTTALIDGDVRAALCQYV